MTAAISVGIDFASSGMRAAYLHQGDLLDVPLGPPTFRWKRWIFMEPAPQNMPQRVMFPSIKERFGINSNILEMEWGERLTLQQIVIGSLSDLKEAIEQYSGRRIGPVAISIPSGFTESRRLLLRECAQKAGFNNVGLINDCTAAAIGHCHSQAETSSTLVVYSLGYCGFETSIIRRTRKSYRVLSHESAATPSGQFFDLILMNRIVGRFQRIASVTNVSRMHAKEWDDLRVSVQHAKEQLVTEPEAKFEVPAALAGGTEPVVATMSREGYHQLIKPFIDETLATVDEMLAHEKLVPNDIREVLLVGASLRTPLVQQAIEQRLGRTPILTGSELLARGAAIHAGSVSDLGAPAPDLVVTPDQTTTATTGNSTEPADLFTLPESYQPQPPATAKEPLENGSEAKPVAPTQSAAEQADLSSISASSVGPPATVPVRGESSPNLVGSFTNSPPSTHRPGGELEEVPRPDVEPLMRYVQYLVDTGHVAKAVGFLQHLMDEAKGMLALSPQKGDRIDARRHLQEAFRFLNSGRYDEAMTASHTAYKLDGADPEILTGMMEIHRQGALRLSSREQFEKAIECLACANRHDPTDVGIRQAIAERCFLHAQATLQELGDPAAATRFLEKALEWNPDHPETIHLLSQLKAKKSGPVTSSN